MKNFEPMNNKNLKKDESEIAYKALLATVSIMYVCVCAAVVITMKILY